MKKSFWGVILCLVLALCLTACKPPKGEEERFKLPSVGRDALILAEQGEKTEYKIVYGKDLSNESRSKVYDAAELISTTYEGAEMRYSISEAFSERNRKGDPEILIGQTNRQESFDVLSLLTGEEQAVIKAFENGRIVINATTEELLTEALDAFLQKYVNGDKDGVLDIPSNLEFVFGKSKEREWTLSLPVYEGGLYAREVYNIGPGRSLDKADSVGRMQVIYNTNLPEFEAYVTALKGAGFQEEVRTEANGNVYVRLYDEADDSKSVYTYYTAAYGEVRVIEEKDAVLESAFEYVCEDGPVTIYQYAMMCNGKGAGFRLGDPYEINGMTYVMRLADNKLIIVDGGNYIQATPRATKAFVQFLRDITGNQDGTIDIAAFFLTHSHGDHYTFIQRIMEDKKLAKQVNIERFMCSITQFAMPDNLGKLFAKTYPNALFMKLHTGQNLRIGNVTFDVMFTHEDFVEPISGICDIVDGNSLSTVLKASFNGRSWMILGDWGGPHDEAPPEYERGEARLLLMHTNEKTGYNALETDVIQIAHHVLNPYMGKIVKAISAEYAFAPTSDVSISQSDSRYTILTTINQFYAAGGSKDRLYFQSRYTYALHFDEEGTITVAAENIRGYDEGDDPTTGDVEQDYVNETLKRADPHRVPTDEEFANWELIH